MIGMAENENHMREILVDKVTLNMGVGEAGDALKKATTIMERVSGSRPVHTLCRIKQPGWGIREGLPIGVKVTLRGKKAEGFLGGAFAAKDNSISKKNFDRNGNFGFGIKEYIDLPKVRYDPQLGIPGLDVLVTLKRRGYRVKSRKRAKAAVGKAHSISTGEAILFIRQKYGVEVK